MLYQVCNPKKKKKNDNFRYTSSVFSLNVSPHILRKGFLPSKLLIPLTCWVFSKVSSEEDRTLRLKRPSQGPSLGHPRNNPHEPSSEPQKKNTLQEIFAYPTEREVRKIIDSKCHDFGGYVIVPWRVKNLMSLCIILVVENRVPHNECIIIPI